MRRSWNLVVFNWFIVICLNPTFGNLAETGHKLGESGYLIKSIGSGDGPIGSTNFPKTNTGWWFQILFIFTPTWGRFPIWLIFFQRGWNSPTRITRTCLAGKWDTISLGGDNTSTHSNVVAFPDSHVRFSRGVMSNLFLPMLSAYQNTKVLPFNPPGFW